MKNRKIFSRLLLPVLLAAITLLFGCGKQPDFTPVEGKPTAIVIARRANAALPDEAVRQELRTVLAEGLTTAKEGESYIVSAAFPVIISDGRPSGRLFLYKSAANNSTVLEKKKTQLLDSLMDDLFREDFKADDEGADLLAALAEAKSCLPEGGRLVIIDTGLTESGYLPMGKGSFDLSSADPAQLVQTVLPGGFADLSGLEVSFYNLGNVCGSQTDYRANTQYRAALEQLWTEIITEQCHAALAQPIRFAAKGGEEQLYLEDGSGYPYVAPILFPGCDTPVLTDYYKLEAAAIGFLPNSAKLRDEALAAATVQQAADWWVQYSAADPAASLYVVGSIAKVTAEDTALTSTVSASRAAAVADLLAKAGIPAEKLVVVDGAARRFDWNEDELNPDGTLDPAKQQANRCVTLIPSGTAQAAQLAGLV